MKTVPIRIKITANTDDLTALLDKAKEQINELKATLKAISNFEIVIKTESDYKDGGKEE